MYLAGSTSDGPPGRGGCSMFFSLTYRVCKLVRGVNTSAGKDVSLAEDTILIPFNTIRHVMFKTSDGRSIRGFGGARENYRCSLRGEQPMLAS